jgi:uncharacterized membrane protein
VGAPSLLLPAAGGGTVTYTMRAPEPLPAPAAARAPRSRIALAAAHVVADPLADNTPGQPAVLDWDATLAFRRHLWSHGLGVAEAMDTAQRGMGLGHAAAIELVRRSAAEARACGGRIAAGAGTDQLPPSQQQPPDLKDVIAAYEQQAAAVEEAGAQVVLMASRHLARAARHADDYLEVCGRVLEQLSAPAILHWLGPSFDPALAGYWGSPDLDEAAGTLLRLVAEHRDRVDGVKLSLLDAEREIALRRRLPPGVRLYTGDDFNYQALIRGDRHGYSDALLGVFDAIAPLAAAALRGMTQATIKLGLEVWPSPLWATFIGYVMSSLVVLAVQRVRQSRFIAQAPASGLTWFAVTGIFNGLATLSMFSAVRHGPITLVAPIVAVYPLVTVLLSAIMLKHIAITARIVAGTILTVAGVALVLAG